MIRGRQHAVVSSKHRCDVLRSTVLAACVLYGNEVEAWAVYCFLLGVAYCGP